MQNHGPEWDTAPDPYQKGDSGNTGYTGGSCCLLRKNYGIHVIYQLRAYLFGDSGAVLAKSFTDLFEFLPVVKPGLYAEPVFTAHMLILVHMVLLFWSEQQVETNVAIIDFSEGLSSSHPSEGLTSGYKICWWNFV
jgi:hypothetical protein